jgi:hypothetical protein
LQYTAKARCGKGEEFRVIKGGPNNFNFVHFFFAEYIKFEQKQCSVSPSVSSCGSKSCKDNMLIPGTLSLDIDKNIYKMISFFSFSLFFKLTKGESFYQSGRNAHSLHKSKLLPLLM